MKIHHVVMVIIFSVGMGLGQLLFKWSAIRQTKIEDTSFQLRLISLLCDWPFLFGLMLYCTLTVYWIWLLTFLPLSRVYPFTFLSLAVAAVGSAVLFHEHLTLTYVTGLAIIGVGLVVMSAG